MVNRQLTAFRLSPELIEVLGEMTHADRAVTTPGPDNKTRCLEAMCEHFVREALKGKVNKPLLAAKRKPEEVFQLYADIAKAERGEPGYKVYKHPKVGIVAVTGPEDD